MPKRKLPHNKLRDQLLFEQQRTIETGTRRAAVSLDTPGNNRRKTFAMAFLERQHSKPIEELLSPSTREVMNTLGISRVQVWRWRRRLGLPTT